MIFMRRKKGEKVGGSAPEETSGFAGGVWGFLKLLEEMENKGETTRAGTGRSAGFFGSTAVCDYTIKIGMESGDSPLKGGFHPRPRPGSHVHPAKRARVKQDPAIDVFDGGDHISDVAQVPHDRGKRSTEIDNNALKIAAKTPEGKIKREIPLSEGGVVNETE